MEIQRRNTKQTQRVLALFANEGAALSSESIEKKLAGDVDRVTVYRILQRFCNDGVIHRIAGDNGKTYYAPCHDCCSAGHHQDDHLHFRCLTCGNVTCLNEPLTIGKLPRGYRAESVFCLILGKCPKCSSTKKSAGAPAKRAAARSKSSSAPKRRRALGTITAALALLLCTAAAAQTKVQITDNASHAPVPFANVYFPDSKTGTMADSNGMFSISKRAKSILVQVAVLGYKTFLQELSLRDTLLSIKLEPSVHELQEIVVSDNTPGLQGENVSNVTRLSLGSAGVATGSSLAEKLTSVPGVSNWSTGTGIGKPVIRGMSGNRIAVFSQGVRVENQQWGDEHGLGIDEQGYEQVEIIKGPASLLYGSDALGGVLYFADERYAQENSTDANISSEFSSNTCGWRTTGSLRTSQQRLHLNASGSYTTHGDYRDGNNETVVNSRFHTAGAKATLGYTGRQFISALRYSFLAENFGLLSEEEIDKNNETVVLMPHQELATHIVSSENTLFLQRGGKLKLDAGYLFNNRKEFEEDGADAALNMNLGTASYNLKYYSPSLWQHLKLTVGSQGMYQRNANAGEEWLIPNATTIDFGLFAVAALHFAERSLWQTGVRFDNRSIHAASHSDEDGNLQLPEFSKSYRAFTFSTGIFQPLSQHLSLRTNITSGYRAPSLFELLSNGVHEGTNRFERGSTALKTENSYQLDAALNFRSTHLEMFANPYLNYVRRYIYLDPTGTEIDGNEVWNYAQTNALLYGGEAGFHFHPHPLDWLHVEGAYSCTIGQNSSHAALPLIPAQKISATLSANFAWKGWMQRLSVFVQNAYSLAQNRTAQYELPTPAYNLVNVGLHVDWCPRLSAKIDLPIGLHISANNLFNVRYYDHLSRYKADGILNPGRSIVAKVSIKI